MARLVTVSICLGLATIVAAGQSSSPAKFDVAVLKLATSAGHSNRRNPELVDLHGYDLGRLIQIAFAVEPQQIAASTKVLEYGPYDLIAKMPPGTSKAQEREMFQSLLAERLNLKVHRERRDIPVYRLTVISGGPYMKPAETPAEPGQSPCHYGGSFIGNTRGIHGCASMEELAGLLRSSLDWSEPQN
jgi:uncharacterized protein (TIGR03435 family)